MQRIKFVFIFRLLGMIALLSSYVPDVEAIPAFSRKYDVECEICHSAFPKLNDFGVEFKDNGYQMGKESDLPKNIEKGYFPIAFRTKAGYEYARQSPVEGKTGNSTDNYASGFGSFGIDILSGGTLERDISFLVAAAGGDSLLGGAAPLEMESAWVRLDNLAGTPMLNLKIGYGDIDLPFSEMRSLTFNTGYEIYHYVPGTPYNTKNFKVGDIRSTALSNLDTFSFGSHQGVFQLMGHTADGIGIFRYEVNAIGNNQYGGHDMGYYLHVTQSINGGGYSSAYRGGLFYLNMPISTKYDNQAGAPPAGPNVGSAAKPITRYGVDLSGNFFENKINIFGVYMLAQDDKELITGATDDAKFWGGFLEANYLATDRLILIGRYDLIRNSTEPLSAITPVVGPAMSSDGYNDVNGYTVAARYELSESSRGGLFVHAELNQTDNKKTAFDGSDQKNETVFLGFDLSY